MSLFSIKRLDSSNYDTIEPLLSLVEPHPREFLDIWLCLTETNVYRAYSIVDEKDDVCGLAIATLLPITNTLHVEDFALDPKIRGKGYARQLWKQWWDYIVNTEHWISNDQQMTIEVYCHNIEAWRKIMQVNDLEEAVIPMSRVRIWWMGKNLKQDVTEIKLEWIDVMHEETCRRQRTKELIKTVTALLSS